MDNTPEYVKNFKYIKDLQGDKRISPILEKLFFANQELSYIAREIEKNHPEFAEEIYKAIRQNSKIRHELAHHRDGFISYA